MLTQLFFIIITISTAVNGYQLNQNSSLIGSIFVNEILKSIGNDTNCSRALQQLAVDFDSRQKWALTIMDSWGNFPSGLLSGNVADFGHFDQCWSSKFKAENNSLSLLPSYCLVPYHKPGNTSAEDVLFTIGACFPSVCNETEIKSVLEKSSAKDAEFKFYSKNSVQCLEPAVNELSSIELSAWMVIAGVILLSVGSEFLQHFWKKCPGWLSSFSIMNNYKSLTQVASNRNRIGCLDGLRTLSMFCILALHTLQVHLPQPYSYNVTTQKQTNYRYYYLDKGVDVFFVIGGLTLTITFLKAREKRSPFNLWNFYTHRYFRVVPAVAFLILIATAVNENLFGPNVVWVKDLHQRCRTTWWYYLVGIQNYVKDKSCLSHVWYVGADMQLYLLSPLLLFPLQKYGGKFVKILAMIFIASGVYLRYAFMIHDHHLTFGTHARFGPWIAGIILGFYLSQRQGRDTTVGMKKIAKYLTLSIISWSLIFYAFKSSAVNPHVHYLHRHLYSVFYCWVISSCFNGYLPVVDRFLSIPVFQVTSKLSYCVYLLHLPVWDALIALKRFPVFYEPVTRFYEFLSLTFVSLGLAFIWTLLFEIPWSNFWRSFTKTEYAPVPKKEPEYSPRKESEEA